MTFNYRSFGEVYIEAIKYAFVDIFRQIGIKIKIEQPETPTSMDLLYFVTIEHDESMKYIYFRTCFPFCMLVFFSVNSIDSECRVVYCHVWEENFNFILKKNIHSIFIEIVPHWMHTVLSVLFNYSVCNIHISSCIIDTSKLIMCNLHRWIDRFSNVNFN